jgi:hypothetical protein
MPTRNLFLLSLFACATLPIAKGVNFSGFGGQEGAIKVLHQTHAKERKDGRRLAIHTYNFTTHEKDCVPISWDGTENFKHEFSLHRIFASVNTTTMFSTTDPSRAGLFHVPACFISM